MAADRYHVLVTGTMLYPDDPREQGPDAGRGRMPKGGGLVQAEEARKIIEDGPICFVLTVSERDDV